MLEIDIPGFDIVKLKHLVLDLNGTLTNQGILIAHVKEQLRSLKKDLEVIIVSADTFGRANAIKDELEVSLKTIDSQSNESEQKVKIVEDLRCESVVAIGNGNNDQAMLKKARIGIVVIGPEGASVHTIMNATIVVYSITDALQMLLNPQILKATLRY